MHASIRDMTNAKTREILELYFSEERSLSETAKELGVNRRAVENAIKGAGCKLRPVGQGIRLSKLGRQRRILSLQRPDRQPLDKWRLVELRAAGKTNKEIATVLALSVYTVDAHRGRIMEKLNLHSINELVRFAVRKGLID